MIKAVFTCGDINGIGPEIAIKSFQRLFDKKKNECLIYIAPQNVFEFYYDHLKSKFPFKYVTVNEEFSHNYLNIIKLNDTIFAPGKISGRSGKISYLSIIKSLELIKAQKADVLITSPISKEAIYKGGIIIPGHTELLAKFDNSRDYLMMFLSNQIKAALLTIHEPIKNIPELIDESKIISAVKMLNLTAKKDFGIMKPKIALLGLNPHAGENGLIGNEEKEIIIPTIKKLKQNYILDGPFVPDAFWGNKIFKKYDIILGMYHDQVLIPFKLLHFNSGVNFTAGLSLIRTSPDHGTAFDIAGKMIADPSSLLNSYYFARKIFKNRKKHLG